MTLTVAVRFAGAVLVNTVGAGPAEGCRAGAVCRAVRGATGCGAASAEGGLVNTVGAGPDRRVELQVVGTVQARPNGNVLTIHATGVHKRTAG